MLIVGCRYAVRYEPGHGIAIPTLLYRRMRQRYVDWMRATIGDTRSATTRRRILASAFVPMREAEGATWDDDSGDLDEAISGLGGTSPRPRAPHCARSCRPSPRASTIGVRRMDVEARLAELREELVG